MSHKENKEQMITLRDNLNDIADAPEPPVPFKETRFGSWLTKGWAYWCRCWKSFAFTMGWLYFSITFLAFQLSGIWEYVTWVCR